MYLYNIRDSICDGIKIVRNHHDTIVWLKLDRSFFKIENDIYLACSYIWCENSPAYNCVDVDLFPYYKLILYISSHLVPFYYVVI